MRGIGRTTATLVACALAAVLAGCERDPVGPVDPTDSPPSTSASPTPTEPTPPVMPEAAKSETAAGAVQFARHYIRLLNYAANTGDVRPLRAASSECSGCDDYAALYTRVYEAGGYYRTPGWVPERLTPSELEGSFGLAVDVRVPAAEYQESSSSEVFQTKATEYTLLLTTRRVSDQWRVISLRDGTT